MTAPQCGICREPATVFVVCDRLYFRGFRCDADARPLIAELESQGCRCHVSYVRPTVADATGAP